MKKSFINPEPIEIDIETINGEKKTLVIKVISDSIVKDMAKIDTKEDNALQKQMAVLFGGEYADYLDIDIRVVVEILTYVTGVMANPSQGKAE